MDITHKEYYNSIQYQQDLEEKKDLEKLVLSPYSVSLTQDEYDRLIELTKILLPYKSYTPKASKIELPKPIKKEEVKTVKEKKPKKILSPNHSKLKYDTLVISIEQYKELDIIDEIVNENFRREYYKYLESNKAKKHEVAKFLCITRMSLNRITSRKAYSIKTSNLVLASKLFKVDISVFFTI